MIRFAAVLAIAFLAASAVRAQDATPTDRVGDTYELSLRSNRQSTASNGSSGASNSGGALVERVTAIRPDGLELEFDLPADATPQDRARDWQWPVRVLWRSDAGMELLNTAELEQRITAWLTAMNIPREACGQWGFSWTAYKIECDPYSVLDTIKVYDLRTPLDGAGIGAASANGASIIVETPVDEAEVLRDLAEMDAIVSRISGDAPEAAAARAGRAVVQASGTRTVTRESDAEGRPVRQVERVQLETVTASAVTETRTTTQTVTRRLIRTAP